VPANRRRLPQRFQRKAAEEACSSKIFLRTLPKKQRNLNHLRL
jgi:hypothetical protein